MNVFSGKSVAVGSKFFVEKIKSQLRLRAKERKIGEIDDAFQLREVMQSIPLF
jgi:hypothetical protein